MNTKKALIFLMINTLLLGGFPDYRINMQPDYRFPAYSSLHTIPSKTVDPTQVTPPAQLPSVYELIATATPAPTPTPKPTPVPTRVPIGPEELQSLAPGELTFDYPEPAPLNTDTDTYTLLVNKEHLLSSKYIPYMVEPDVEIYHKGINERRYLQPIAATALEELFAAAELDGFHLVLRCGFRSYKLQKSIYSWNLKTYGYYEVTRYHALPGTSEHQTGLAVDLCCEATNYENNYDFLKTPEYKWLLENAHLYGWILRYPEDKTEITGYNFEPWHFRYVGTELAAYLKEQNLVLEEYYGALPTTNLLAVPEEYWDDLSDEDFAFMMEEIAEYEQKQSEAAQQPTPTPEPESDDTSEPEISPTPETDDSTTQGSDNTGTPEADDTTTPAPGEPTTPDVTPTPIPDETEIPNTIVPTAPDIAL